jgi:putative PEP-CTERM system TPR-repeat lipoprotein
MTKLSVALSIALAFATSAALSGCDRISNLTEQEHIQRAKDFEDKGNLKASIVELKNAVQKNPDSPQARLLLGQIYLKVGLGAEAEKELSQAVKLGVSRETLKPQLGESLLLMGEYKRVLDEIQPGEQTSKANLARIFQLRADALLALGQLKDACNLFNQSFDADKSNPATYWGLAKCAIAERNNTKAREWLDAALKLQEKQAQTWIFVGGLAQLDKDTEGALAAYSSALKIDPENLAALQSRATILTKLGRMEPARADIDTIRKLYPKSLAANYLQAAFKFREKKYPEARDALLETLKIAPDYVPALVLAGLTENALGNAQTAETYLNKAVRAAPRNGFALLMLAATQLRLGRPDDAAKTLAPIDIEKTRNAGLHTIAGEIALANKDFAKAAAHFEAAAEISPDSAAIRTELGMTRLSQGDNQAMADLQAAADMAGDSTRADNVLILTQLKQKQFDAALDRITELEKKQPQSPLAWNYRGAAYIGKKDAAKARNSFEQALKLDPKFFPAVVNLAQLDLAEGKTDQARKRFENILQTDPKHLQSMLALADLSVRIKDEKAYTSWLGKAIQAHPQAVLPRTALVRYYLANKEPQKALALAKETANANPESPQALGFLGSTQLAAGDKASAIATLTRLTEKARQSPDAYLQLALAQLADRRLNDARISLQRALQLNPGHPQSQDALLRLELANKQPEAALKIARQIQSQHPGAPVGFDREADILMSQKRYPQAIKAYEQALEKGAGTATLAKLHRALSAAGDTQAAEQRLVGWIKQHPQDLAARNYAAESYMRTQRNREAIAQYEILLKAKPDNVIFLNNLATLYQREKDPRALATAEQALKLAPDQPGVQDTLGWILVEQGKLPRGLDLLRKAAARAPKSAALRYHYGVALARSGKKAEAKKELEAALANGLGLPELEAAKAMLKSL